MKYRKRSFCVLAAFALGLGGGCTDAQPLSPEQPVTAPAVVPSLFATQPQQPPEAQPIEQPTTDDVTPQDIGQQREYTPANAEQAQPTETRPIDQLTTLVNEYRSLEHELKTVRRENPTNTAEITRLERRLTEIETTIFGVQPESSSKAAPTEAKADTPAQPPHPPVPSVASNREQWDVFKDFGTKD